LEFPHCAILFVIHWVLINSFQVHTARRGNRGGKPHYPSNHAISPFAGLRNYLSRTSRTKPGDLQKFGIWVRFLDLALFQLRRE